MKEKKINIKKILLCSILTLCSILIAMWIFSNSMRNGTDSSQQSHNVTEDVQDIIGSIAPSSPVATAKGDAFDKLHHFIRKSAHFLEFMALGMSLTFTCLSYTRLKRYFFIPPCLVVIVASTDEFIQKFSGGRTSSIKDVLIDSSGGATGIIVALLLFLVGVLIYRHYKKKKEEKLRLVG